MGVHRKRKKEKEKPNAVLMWKLNNRPGYYRGEQKNMRRNFTPLLCAVAGTIVLFLLWTNHNLQFQLESHEQAEEGLVGELDSAKARYVQIERRKSLVRSKSRHVNTPKGRDSRREKPGQV